MRTTAGGNSTGIRGLRGCATERTLCLSVYVLKAVTSCFKLTYNFLSVLENIQPGMLDIVITETLAERHMFETRKLLAARHMHAEVGA